MLDLQSALLDLDEDVERLETIQGAPADPSNLPEGCKFHPRCKHCQEICKHQPPPVQREGEHVFRCHFKLF